MSYKKKKTFANVNIIILQTNNSSQMLIKKIHKCTKTYLYFQSVATEPMDTVVLTTVVVTVWVTLHVTNRLDTVTEDVNPDIQMPFVAKVNKKKVSQQYYF